LKGIAGRKTGRLERPVKIAFYCAAVSHHPPVYRPGDVVHRADGVAAPARGRCLDRAVAVFPEGGDQP
jgi:hypothetical protein